MGSINIIFGIVVLILSVMVHEVSHGYSADKLGDPTARLAGRLTLNPIKHLDFFGSIIVPAITFMAGGFIFGWAKPVPYNPYNLQHKRGDAIVAAAGPISNILLALFFSIIIRLNGSILFLPSSFIELSVLIVFINLILAIFNLIPVPPLDGSKILYSFLPAHLLPELRRFESYGLFLVLLVVIFLWKFIFPLVLYFFNLFTGLS